MTTNYKAGRQSAHLNMGDQEFNRRLGAVAGAFGIDWLSAGDRALQVLWQRKDGFAVNQLCLLGDAIAGFNEIDPKWVKDHVKKIKGPDANGRRGSMFELLGANLLPICRRAASTLLLGAGAGGRPPRSTHTGPSYTICAAPARNGERSTRAPQKP